MRRGIRFSVIGIFLLALTAPVRAAEPPPLPPELSEAIAKLKSWRASFATLRIQWKWKNRGQVIERVPELKDDEARLEGWYHLDELLWTDRQLVRHDTHVFENGRLAKRDLAARNAKLQFGASYEGNTQFPEQLGAKRAGAGTEWHFRTAMPLHQVYYYDNSWLSERIDRHSATFVGSKEIGGSKCVGLQVPPGSAETLWLDLEHDGLVRKAEIELRYGVAWECTEFMRVPSGQWFANRGFYFMHDAENPYEFEVLDVQLNEQVPNREFDPPPINDRTIIVDRSGGLLGIPPGRKKSPARPPAPLAEPANLPRGARIDAVPRSNHAFWVTVLGLSAVTLFMGWRLRSRS